jgi:predicted phage tail protein
MPITVNFSKLLVKYTNTPSIILDASTYSDVVSACLSLFPSIKQNIIKHSLGNQLTLIDGDYLVRNYELGHAIKGDTIYIIPTVSGRNQVSFDSLGNVSLFYGSGAVSPSTTDLSGLQKRILESSLYGKSSTAFDIAQRRKDRESGSLDAANDPTTGFGSLGTMVAPGTSIPLHFGMVRTSGALITQYIKHIQRGGVDNIKVKDYV